MIFTFSLLNTDMFAKSQCNYCQEDVSGLRVRCAECTDFEICLQVNYYFLITYDCLSSLVYYGIYQFKLCSILSVFLSWC